MSVEQNTSAPPATTPTPAVRAPARLRWPPQIKYIIGNEACERFSYYGIRAILALYISEVLFKDLPAGEAKDRATDIIHLWVFANYFAALFGGWLSDKVWGRYHTIFYVSLIYCLGNLTLAFTVGHTWGLYAGLGLIAFGSGGIKPCVSAFCGDQFRPEQSALLQKAYGLFYWSINFGSFFSFLVIPWVKDTSGYALAFGVPGALMLIATLIFWSGRKHYMRIPPSRETKSAGFGKVTWYALTHLGRRKRGQSFWTVARERFSQREVEAARSVGPILAVFAPICIFWSLFDQTSSTWVMQGNKMVPLTLGEIGFINDLLPHWTAICVGFGLVVFALALYLVFHTFAERTANARAWVRPLFVAIGLGVAALLGWGLKFLPDLELGAEQMQSMNPAFVMILVPLMLWLYPRIEKTTGMRVSPLRRMGAGLVMAAIAYVIVGTLQTRLDKGAQMTVLWQAIPYFVLTTGEVLLSTTGLEFAFTQAAAEMKSTIMSFWLLTVAFGNLFVPILTTFKGYLIAESGEAGASASVNASTFYLYAGLTLGVAVVFTLIATRYKERELELTNSRG